MFPPDSRFESLLSTCWPYRRHRNAHSHAMPLFLCDTSVNATISQSDIKLEDVQAVLNKISIYLQSLTEETSYAQCQDFGWYPRISLIKRLGQQDAVIEVANDPANSLEPYLRTQ